MFRTAANQQIWNDYRNIQNKLDELFYESYPRKDYENISRALFRCFELFENILNDLNTDGITPERQEEIRLYLSIINGHIREDKDYNVHIKEKSDDFDPVVIKKKSKKK
jgi:hypothetical protein